jgi:hypothetical protein
MPPTFKLLLDYLQGHILFWSVTLLIMVADDAAMMAMMFS